MCVDVVVAIGRYSYMFAFAISVAHFLFSLAFNLNEVGVC